MWKQSKSSVPSISIDVLGKVKIEPFDYAHYAKIQKYEQGKIGLQFFDVVLI